MPKRPSKTSEDEFFMQKALREARKAGVMDEVPIGAVVVQDGKILSRAFNQRERKQDPIYHAELVAISKAARKLKSWRLTDCTLYVTLEPCAMCAGAVILSRMSRVVFGADDPKAGAAGSVVNVLSEKRLSHEPQVSKGICRAECALLIQSFFKKLRKSKKK